MSIATFPGLRPALPLAAMAKRQARDESPTSPAEPTEPKNFRLRQSVIERVEAYKSRHPLRPTLTQIIEAALVEYIDQHEGELPPVPKPSK